MLGASVGKMVLPPEQRGCTLFGIYESYPFTKKLKLSYPYREPTFKVRSKKESIYGKGCARRGSNPYERSDHFL
jgi:hypothetical protein